MRFFCAFICLFLAGHSGLAHAKCSADWTVQSHKMGDLIHLAVTEASVTGPGCDLVLTNLTYTEDSNRLSLTLTPVKFCPLDSVGHRSGTVMWQLPYLQRSSSSLALNVNGREVGILQLGADDQAVFVGGCK